MTSQAPQPPPQFDIKPAIYRSRGVQGSQQYGESKSGHPELLLLVNLLDLNRQVTTVLFFSPDAAKYSIQRLRALGCESQDLSNLVGLDAKEVLTQIAYEMFEGKMQMKAQILSGSGQFSTAKPLDPKVWAARVAQILNGSNVKAPAIEDKPPF
jgi:hypothetical protein